MRYYVVCPSDTPGIGPHVVAEVVRDDDGSDESAREHTLASALAGDNAVIATRAELADNPLTRDALREWERGDDSAYDAETVRLELADDPGPPELVLVLPIDVESDAGADWRALVVAAAAERVRTRALVATSQARRRLLSQNIDASKLVSRREAEG